MKLYYFNPINYCSELDLINWEKADINDPSTYPEKYTLVVFGENEIS